MPEKRSFRQRVQRFRHLWRATATGAELGYTGPAELAELNPPANRYWITQRLQQADDEEQQRKAAHGYVLHTLRIAERQAAETGDATLQAEVDRARLWLAECDLVTVSLLEQAQQAGSHTVVEDRMDHPEQYQPEHKPESVPSPEPVDLDHITGDGRR